MRTLQITAILMAALPGVSAGARAHGKSENGRQVTVYFNDHTDAPLAVPDQAKILASGIFAGIGVTLRWKFGRPSRSETAAIALEFVKHAPATLLPDVLAYALPYEGVHIRIFWDRIAAAPFPRQLLAHVMVHEITHILQGFSGHSAEGIMKARWTEKERNVMGLSPLHFRPEDVELIYRGMDTRGARRVAAPAVEVVAQ